MIPPNVWIMRMLFFIKLGHLARWVVRGTLITVAFVAIASAANAQRVFPGAAEAADALVEALKSGERGGVLDVLGRSAFDILSSGDDLADTASRKRFVEDYGLKRRIVMLGDREAILVVGAAETSFPIPLMRAQGGWQFDITTGRQELLRARIARNEEKAIEASRAYVKAQLDYAAMMAKDGQKQYAQRILSRPGQKDGLFWSAASGEGKSPLHDLVERAVADGYSLGKPRMPYHGYLFKVLAKQGPKAAGGSFDYNEQGKMIHGFALIAYPVRYGHSGVMTFLVNQRGVVYQKDLGAYTTRFANREIWFNPDQTWRKAAPSDGGK
jgi:hypothetical protein